MSRTRTPKRRGTDVPTLDLTDLVLALGYEGLKALPEDDQLAGLLIPTSELDREWPIRRERLLQEASKHGWPVPLGWERYGQ